MWPRNGKKHINNKGICYRAVPAVTLASFGLMAPKLNTVVQNLPLCNTIRYFCILQEQYTNRHITKSSQNNRSIPESIYKK